MTIFNTKKGANDHAANKKRSKDTGSHISTLLTFLGFFIGYLIQTQGIEVLAGWFRRMAFIITPLARHGLLAGWLAGYIFSLRDTGVTMLVYPAGHEALPVRIFTLMANGSPELIDVLCVATLLPAGMLWMLPNFIARKASR